MTQSHTPGPWIATDENIHSTVNWYQVAEANTALDEVEYNACLIAAAPEMLEALQKILRRAWPHADENDADRKRNLYHVEAIATAAIAKATGAA